MSDSSTSLYVEILYRTGDNYKTYYSLKLSSQNLSVEELKRRITSQMIDGQHFEPSIFAPLALPYPPDFNPAIDPTWFELVGFHEADDVVKETWYLGEVVW